VTMRLIDKGKGERGVAKKSAPKPYKFPLMYLAASCQNLRSRPTGLRHFRPWAFGRNPNSSND